MRRIRRKKIKWSRVLVLIIFLMIIVGGIVMTGKYFFKNQEDTQVEKNNNTYQEENPKQEEELNQTNANLDKAPTNYSQFRELNDGEYLTEKGYTLKIENGIAYIDGHLIVNKTYALPSTYQPQNPYIAITNERCINCIETEAMESFKLMESDASTVGLNLYLASGYRSYEYQERLYNNYTAVSGVDKADTYSARAGHSEHQTGLAFDLNSVDDSFAYTDEGKWVNDNAHLYGFIIRYPKGKESITGYQYESWHLRYVGESLAKELYNNGDWITLEEYYGISSSY